MKNKLTICILFASATSFNISSSIYIIDLQIHTFIGRWAGGRCLTDTSVGIYTYIGDGGILKF